MADLVRPIVYKPGGRGRAVAYTAAPILVVVGLALTVVGLIEAGPAGLLSLVLALLGALGMTTLRQRAVITERDLTVQGRFTRRDVHLGDVRDVHEDRTHTVWLAADGQQPFRVYFARPLASERDADESFVSVLRHRAAACGASVGVDDELVARPPKGTSPFFSL